MMMIRMVMRLIALLGSRLGVPLVIPRVDEAQTSRTKRPAEGYGCQLALAGTRRPLCVHKGLHNLKG